VRVLCGDRHLAAPDGGFLRGRPGTGARIVSRQDKVIVVFRSAALGDFVIASPALRAVRDTWPGAHIVLVTIASANRQVSRAVAAYAHHAPWLELVMPHLVDEAIVLDNHALLGDAMRARTRLRAFKVERAVLLLDPGAPWPGRFKKMLLLWLLCGPVPLLGWRRPGSVNGDLKALHRQGLLTHHVHGPMQFLSELRPPVPYDDSDIRFDLRVPAGSDEQAAQLLHRAAPSGKTLVAVAPGSIQAHKRWPIGKFAELCRGLLAFDPGVHLLVIGTAADQPLGETLRALAPDRVLNLAGDTAIPVSAALLARCALLVGNDGGAMHLGDAMGCKVVSIVPGIQYPDSIEPWHNKVHAIRHDVPCAPCYDFLKCPQGHNRCMADLPVARVLERCLALLREAGAGVAAPG